MENDKDFIKALHCFIRMNSNIDCPVTEVDDQGAINCDICTYNQKEYDVCDECKFLENVSNKLEAIAKELQQYRAIGTVEECREAREKQIAKKPIHGGLYACPNCHTIMLQGAFEAKGKCCKECGQALDWSETV